MRNPAVERAAVRSDISYAMAVSLLNSGYVFVEKYTGECSWVLDPNKE